jgi:hypothetical protein
MEPFSRAEERLVTIPDICLAACNHRHSVRGTGGGAVSGEGHVALSDLTVHLRTVPIGSHRISLNLPLPIASKTLANLSDGRGYSVDVAPLGKVSAVMTFTTPPALRASHRPVAVRASAAHASWTASSAIPVSVVPVGPRPLGLRPQVATQTGQSHTVARPVAPLSSHPALSPLGAGLALTLVALLFATTRFVVANARAVTASPRR